MPEGSLKFKLFNMRLGFAFVRAAYIHKIHKKCHIANLTLGFHLLSKKRCSIASLPNKIALVARKMETLLGIEFETLDSNLRFFH